MKSSPLLLAICLLVSCDKTEKTPPPAGLKSSDLPAAPHSRKIDENESHYIEIIISNDKTEIFHQGKQITSTTTKDELLSALEKGWKQNTALGYATPLLISAPASTPFHIIKECIKTAAEAGIHQILFLVRSNQTSEAQVVFIQLPTTHSLPEITPFFLQITSDGHIYNGTGPSRSQMTTSKQDQQLDKLSEHLNHFSSAAKSAGDPYPPCQIYVDPQASYQRVIDLISLTNKYEMQPYFIDMWEKPATKPISKPMRKPSPPSPAIKPSELAPKD